VTRHDHWIGGAVREPRSGARLVRHSPADGRELASVANGDAADVDAAVLAARQAFDGGTWRELAGGQRASALNRLADIIEARLEEIARVEAEECGKPIAAARADVRYGLDVLRYATALACSMAGRLVTDCGPGGMGMVLQQPRGVAALIVPWNYPVVCLLHKLAYALAAGCSTVIKPSEFTPGSTLLIARWAKEAGIPDGVLNVVIGDGARVGNALVSHPLVDMVSFTGSSRVGALIAQKCAGQLRHHSLELGGKGANIVFDDADLAAAVEGVYAGFTVNAGQECCAGSRVLVQRSIAARFVDQLRARCQAARMGPVLDEQTELGPLIHEQHLKVVTDFIARGQAEGATLATGGRRATGSALEAGLYLEPTLFTDVTPGMAICREEIFGPVACVLVFDTFDEAIALANATRYGLANGVWTSDLDRAMAAVRQVRSGVVWVNTYLQLIPQLPFGGMKDSGIGRENGSEGLQEFLETKGAFVKLGSPQAAAAQAEGRPA
jgi:acyl-CoA reductase-like NAD-dependent aldehyde dehydrogenase